VLHAALRAAAPLRRRKGVLGLSIGMRHRGGQWVPGEHCIAVRVADKASHERELHPRQVLPRSITVELGRKTWQVPVDVRDAGGATAASCYGHIATQIRNEGGECIGGVSACVITTGAPKFLISGHVARRAGRRLTANGVALMTEEPRMTGRLDHCLAGATFNLADASLPNNGKFRGIRSSATVHPGESLFVQRALDGSLHQVTVQETTADTLFEYPTGVTRVFNLIATDDVTDFGDSGCPLFDDHLRLVGTLLGGLDRSQVGSDYYLPADYAFSQLSISLPL
jgi:hypothetical protein